MPSVNTQNIQGSIWPRLPKYYETFLFFKIKDADDFKPHLKAYADANNFTTGAKCKEYLDANYHNDEATERKDLAPAERKPFDAVNVAFSSKGMNELVGEYNDVKLQDELIETGQYKDLVFEGADSPEKLADEYKPPKDQHANNDDWRVHGLFIIASQTKDRLDAKVAEVKKAFGCDTPSASIDIAFVKEGHVRNADGLAHLPVKTDKDGKEYKESIHRKEHFGFEDEISQPQIDGLDPRPKEDEQRAIPPGYIFSGLEGDNTKQPSWAKEGSFLVFREFEEKVPEFNNFVKAESEKMQDTEEMKSFDEEKLAAYMMGRWKNGSPIELDPNGDKPEHAFKNNFDYTPEDPKAKNTKCPFAAHIRKMRPRADHYVERGDESEAVHAKNFVNRSNVILRRSITFGPEVDPKTEEKETKNRRGIYFLCYQGSIRAGFNFMVTRWASRKEFPINKMVGDSPGVDAFISQRNRSDHQEGWISFFGKPDQEKAHHMKLGYLPWIDQMGGEYFFTPSIEALKNKLVNDDE